MRLRTTESLIDEIDGDLAWRKKELSSIKFMADRFRLRPRVIGTVRRAGVALLYAHWEGFLKNASEMYLEFVSNQRLLNSELSANLLGLSARREIHGMGESSKMEQSLLVVRFFKERMTEPARVLAEVQTKSNLSSAVLKNLALTIGVEYRFFETKRNLIDELLVDRRNTIAHGEELEVDHDGFELLFDEVGNMMELWRNQIQNAAVTKNYRISS